MRSILRMGVSVMAGVLCCALVALWVRSHWVSDLVALGGPHARYYEAVTIPGQLRVTWVKGWVGHQRPRHWAGNIPTCWPVFGQQPVYATWFPLGIAIAEGSRRIQTPAMAGSVASPFMVTYRILVVPFAPSVGLAGTVAMWPLWSARRRRARRHQRSARGLCRACGYNLCATPERRPECGIIAR